MKRRHFLKSVIGVVTGLAVVPSVGKGRVTHRPEDISGIMATKENIESTFYINIYNAKGELLTIHMPISAEELMNLQLTRYNFPVDYIMSDAEHEEMIKQLEQKS